MVSDTVFTCPVCGGKLKSDGSSLRCEKNHCFDRASAGYVNLLRSSSASHGDDREMVSARRRFLDGGFYSPMRDALCTLIKEFLPSGSLLLDAGCGEGYYTVRAAACAAHTCALDVSKNAVAAACKRSSAEGVGNIDFAVASVYALPLADSSLGGIISVFSPFALEEFTRTLMPGGRIFSVIPRARHLFALKSAVYDTPYENEVQPTEVEGFTLISESDLDVPFALSKNQDILDLFTMTPYYYRTPKRFSDRLLTLEKLDEKAEFKLLVYSKN